MTREADYAATGTWPDPPREWCDGCGGRMSWTLCVDGFISGCEDVCCSGGEGPSGRRLVWAQGFWLGLSHERKAPLQPETIDDALRLHPTDLFAAQQRAQRALWILGVAHARHIADARKCLRAAGFRFEGDG